MIHEAAERKPAVRPAKRWRNVWRVMRRSITTCHACGHKEQLEPGAFMRSHCRTYPSYELAEQHAAELDAEAKALGRDTAHYLGPEPVDKPRW